MAPKRPKLTFDGEYLWNGRATLPWLKRGNLTICIHANAAGPTAWQYALLDAALAHDEMLMPQLEECLWSYYQENVYGYMGVADSFEWFCGESKEAPKLTRPKQIWRVVSLLGLDIGDRPPWRKRVEFALDFSCNWDWEHGLAVLVRDWKFVDVGGQGDF
jgi:hypothetical protein